MFRNAERPGSRPAPDSDQMQALMAEANEMNPATVEAVDWIVRLTSREATDEDLRALHAWREAAPENDAAYRAFATIRPIGKALKEKPRISRRAVLSGGSASLAAVATLGLIRPPLGLWPSLAEIMADHRTGPGQRYAFSPIAGVDVEMNSRTSVSLIGEGEGIQLIDGEAFVRIERADSFVVNARSASIRGRSATLNVGTLAGGLRVACLSGELDCSTGVAVTRIGPGREWSLNADGRPDTRPIDTAIATSWRDGILRFNRTPLAEVVEQFNRYRAVPIMLTAPSVSSRPVSGYFYTNDTDAAVAQIQQLLGLNVRHLPGKVILIS